MNLSDENEAGNRASAPSAPALRTAAPPASRARETLLERACGAALCAVLAAGCGQKDGSIQPDPRATGIAVVVNASDPSRNILMVRATVTMLRSVIRALFGTW